MYTITGALQINQHCRFPWSEREGELIRRVELRPHHCARCIEDLRSAARERALEIVDLRWTAAAGQGRILIVEDDALIRESLSGLLADEGYAVETARHGAEAIAVLRAKHDVRLIFLDLVMPVLDGWALIHELRASPELARIPVCVITATPNDPPVGAVEILRKPLDDTALLAVAERRAAFAR